MRFLRWPCLLATLIALAGCSTHERRFEADVPPQDTGPVAQDLTAHEINVDHVMTRSLLRRFAPQRPQLPTVALATFARAAALGYIGQRDLPKRDVDGLRDQARAFADALIRRAVPMKSGKGYPSAAGAPPNPRATALAANALVDVFLATGTPRYAREVGLACGALVALDDNWPPDGGHPVSGTTLGSPRYAIAAGGGFDLAATAAAAQALQRASSVDISSGSTGIDPERPRHKELAVEHGLGGSAARLVAAAMSGDPTFPVVAPAAPGPGQTTFILSDAYYSPDPAMKAVAAAQGAGLVRSVFRRNGSPRPGTRPLIAALALSAIDPQAKGPVRPLEWVVRHNRPDQTVARASSGDAVSQAWVALALARRVYFLGRGASPQP
jgi:hypothetical protein